MDEVGDLVDIGRSFMSTSRRATLVTGMPSRSVTSTGVDAPRGVHVHRSSARACGASTSMRCARRRRSRWSSAAGVDG